MTSINIGEDTISLPNTYAVYMYSPFPIIITSDVHTSVTMIVECAQTGLSHSETRRLYDSRAEFDLSRIAQILAPDVTGVFQMTENSQEGDASPYVDLKITIESSSETLYSLDLYALYGSLDQTESRNMNQRRRLWVNYPQTVQVWREVDTESFLLVLDGDWYPPVNVLDGVDMIEMDLWREEPRAMPAKFVESVKAGNKTVVSPIVTFAGTDLVAGSHYYDLTLVPDLTPRGEGTYLRWLHRDGTFAYWHFRNGSDKTDAVPHISFRRHISGNPAEAESGQYRNQDLADFTESRQMTIGTAADNAEEYEYLCGLITSPVVDRLVTVDGEDRWQRVNVAAGSYSRNTQYNTPNRQVFEVVITLPSRNTITL